MEVQTCAVVRKAVSDVDFDSVTPVCLDRWTGDATIHGKHSTSIAVRGCSNIRELEPVFDCDPSVGHHIVVVGADVVIAPDATVACSVARADIARTQAIDFEWCNSANICGMRRYRENGSGSKVRYGQKRQRKDGFMHEQRRAEFFFFLEISVREDPLTSVCNESRDGGRNECADS